MSATTRKGPLLEAGLCRCCGQIKRCRILNAEYEWQGMKEVYSEMFVDCFGLLLSHLEGGSKQRGICATCVCRLRDASAFRKQVLQCEELLLTSFMNNHDNTNQEADVKPEFELKQELADMHVSVEVKAQDECTDLDDLDRDDADSIKSEATLAELKQAKVKRQKVSPEKVHKKIKKKKIKKLMKKDCKTKAVRGSFNEIEIPRPRSPKTSEQDDHIFHNITTIVENSYVCPFTTSFSDYFCFYCKNTFIDPDKLREHTLEHDPGSFRNFYDPKKLTQIDILKINCRLCPEEITDMDSLKKHLVVHGMTFYQIKNDCLQFKLCTGNITCLECGVQFKFFHALKKHMAEHFGSWICDMCGGHYFDERILRIHVKTHLRTEDDVYPCKECGKTFKSRHNRYLHEARVHKKEAAYPCSKCDEVLFTYALRYRHMIDVHGIERTFACDSCDRRYDSRKTLREHVRRNHLKIMKHECDICDRRFYLPSRLKEHMSTHTGERNFRCEFCGKSFPRLRGLKVHMQSHVPDRKYSCSLCSASFTQNVHLKNHVKRQHQNEDGFVHSM